MKKSIAMAALSSLLAVGVNAQANPFIAKTAPSKQTTKCAEAKCGEGKCGGGSCVDKKADGKCGEGKCGGQNKTGSTSKKADAKCGEGKCGGKK